MEPRELINKLLALPIDDPSTKGGIEFIGIETISLNSNNDTVYKFVGRDKETQCEDKYYLVYSLRQGQVWLSNGFNRISAIIKISFN